MQDFEQWFEKATGNRPFHYQRRFAEASEFPQLVNVPTGCGKTASPRAGSSRSWPEVALFRGSRPKLASKARLRWDKRQRTYFLLYPERGLLLNATAVEIVQLCTGEHTVEGIVRQLAEKYPAQAREKIEREIMAFLAQIDARGLLEVVGSDASNSS